MILLWIFYVQNSYSWTTFYCGSKRLLRQILHYPNMFSLPMIYKLNTTVSKHARRCDKPEWRTKPEWRVICYKYGFWDGKCYSKFFKSLDKNALKSYKGQLDTIVNNENNSRNSLQHFFFSLINLSTTPHLIVNLQYKQTDTTTKGETKV